MTTPTQEQITPEFRREDRYLVLKRKDLAALSPASQNALNDWLDDHFQALPTREYVVVESDWPEYEIVFKMIEARVTGKQPTANLTKEQVDEWAAKSGQSYGAVIERQELNTRFAELARADLVKQVEQKSIELMIALSKVQDLSTACSDLRAENAALKARLEGWNQAWDTKFPKPTSEASR